MQNSRNWERRRISIQIMHTRWMQSYNEIAGWAYDSVNIMPIIYRKLLYKQVGSGKYHCTVPNMLVLDVSIVVSQSLRCLMDATVLICGNILHSICRFWSNSPLYIQILFISRNFGTMLLFDKWCQSNINVIWCSHAVWIVCKVSSDPQCRITLCIEAFHWVKIFHTITSRVVIG